MAFDAFLMPKLYLNALQSIEGALRSRTPDGLPMLCTTCVCLRLHLCVWVHAACMYSCTHTHVCKYLPKYVTTSLAWVSPSSLARNSPQWWRGECLRTPGRAGKCTWSSKTPSKTWHTEQHPMLHIKHPWQGKSKEDASRKPPSTGAQNIPHLLLPTFRPFILESRTVPLDIHTQNHWQLNEPNSLLQFIMFFWSCAKIQWITHVQSIVYTT